MKKITCPSTKGMVKIFDEMAIQTRILALNLALESGQGEFVKKISQGIFSKAVSLYDSIEITAQEISNLLKTFSDRSIDHDNQKTIEKLDEFSEQIDQIRSLAAQNQSEAPEEQPGNHSKESLAHKLDPAKALFYRTFEIQDMLNRFRSDITQPAAAS